MLEWIAVPAIIISAALIPKRKLSDDKKIQIVFENLKVGIEKGEDILHPKLFKKVTNEAYTTFIFSLPLGLPSESFESIKTALEDGLNKEIEFEFDGMLKIKVFKNSLPQKWTFDNDLLTSGWQVPIGKNHEGIVYHDFDKYPHMLVGGVTRFGKTVFIKESFYSLLMKQSEQVEFYILDLKGGMEFGMYQDIPQVKRVAADLLESAQVLHEIVTDIKDKQQFMRSKRYTNIIDTPIKKRKFVIVDEGAELSPSIVEGKEAKQYAKFCQAALSEIARIGGALGYRLIFCTQYPTKEAVPMQVKMNIVARLSFIAASQISSRVILDDVGAEDLPSIPGRAIYKIEKNRTVQVPYISDEFMIKNMEGNKDVIFNTEQNRGVTDNDRQVRNGKD
ncbi:FtsK/SpoIIIE domain-containing protein [Cytobacillus horneckiae]|uniref:FtsK/SpoIIIE domain-containing protein n=1 Tax=Cytobacillus horneckiae TaxID=549687 RepID=UPI00203E6912|nr:FtsK/SpoIIIE domain-containing protein [Cytobacillus horneckiae]MCM3180258.1 FtsK/SpoIIIE domain-containing protein [Cytobacillus horneckiae]